MPRGRLVVGSAPLSRRSAASSPMVAVAVFPLVVLCASMFRPGSSVAAVFGVCGKLLTAWMGQVGAGGSGTPGTSRESSGPAFATTCPG